MKTRPAANEMSSARRQATRIGYGAIDAVVAEPCHRRRMDLEVEVRRPALGVAGVPDEADHVAGLHSLPVDRERRVGGEVRVVEVVAAVVAQPQPVAADLDEAHGVDRPVRDREHRRSRWREDVLAVVPAPRDVRPRGAEAVAERHVVAEYREDVAAGREPRRDLGRGEHGPSWDRRARVLRLGRLWQIRADGDRRSGRSRRRPGRPGSGAGLRDRDGRGAGNDDLASGGEASVVGEQPDTQAGDRRLRSRRTRLRASDVLRQDRERAPVRERGSGSTCRREVLVERPQSLHRRRRRLPFGRARARSRARRRGQLRRGDLAVEEREHDHLGERLRGRGLPRLPGDDGARATDPDDRAVARVLERLHVRADVRRPGELAQRDGLLAGDDDADEVRARGRRRGARRRRCRSGQRDREKDGRAGEGGDSDHSGPAHGDSG